jgi:dienelactone hydrolase
MGMRRGNVGRLLGSFVAGLVGLLLVALLFGGSGSSWLLWIAVGALAGTLGGTARHVWVGWLAVAAFYPVSLALGITEALGPFWFLAALIGCLLVSVGFVVGAQLRVRPGLRSRLLAAGHVLGRPWHSIVAGALAIAMIGATGYTAYVGAVGSAAIVHPVDKGTRCDTPGSRFGWAYEAINYVGADDARLLAANPDPTHCGSQGSPAGDAVVTSDGIRMAGWYIPAADGIGPTGPTLVLAHGWKANKSDMLAYAEPLHAAYNLVLPDLRNGGRSGGDSTSWGVLEQRDVGAIVDWLVAEKGPGWIGSIGDSMGAATVLAEAVGDPRVRALVLESMHGTALASIGNGLEIENGHPALPGSWAIVLGVSLRIGSDFTSVDPVRMIGLMGDRPVLLVHGTADALDRPAESADLNFHAALAAGVPVELEYCPGGTHGRVVATCPAQWARWTTAFLAAARAEDVGELGE